MSANGIKLDEGWFEMTINTHGLIKQYIREHGVPVA